MRGIDVDSASTRELIELAERQVDAWTHAARDLVPSDVVGIDAHCHVGVDTDGAAITAEQLRAQLDGAGMTHACVAPLHHRAGYVEANAEIRAVAASSGGRLHALHRCDPNVRDIEGDVRAGLGAGAVGLKWHPRGEAFGMADEVAQRSAAVAHEAGVPILIHAGRGMDRLGEGVVDLAQRFPRATFVLAHAAISDLSWIVDATRDVPNVVFDTSWWRPTDLAVLLSTAPVDRLFHGSDPPYGTARMGVQITARLARACGYDDEAMRMLMGGNAARAFGLGTAAASASTIDRSTIAMPVDEPMMRRAAEYLASAIQVEFSGGDARESFDLAVCALHVRDEHPRARDASALSAAIEVGHALFQRDRADREREEPSPGGFPTSSTWRIGAELLVCTLLHLATPSLPIHGVDRVSWDDPAPFV